MNQDISTHSDDISLHFCRKLAFGLGGVPMQMFSSIITFYISIFLLEVVKVDNIIFVIVTVMGRVSDAVTDPLAGFLLQRYSEKKHIVKISMTISTVVLSISFFLLFFNIRNSSIYVQGIFYTFIIICYQTSMTFYFIPYVSLTMRITSYQTERDKLTSYRIVFEILGMLLGSGMFGGIITVFRPSIESCKMTNITDILIKDQGKGYMIASSLSILIVLICAFLTIFGSIEKNSFKESEILNIKFYKKILTFRPYIILMITFGFTAIGMMFVQANMALYIIHVLKMPNVMAYGILVMLTFAILLIPFAQLLINKFGKKIIYYSGIVTVMPILVALIFLPEHIGKVLFFAIMIYTSYPVMISFLLPWSMLPDCIDLFTSIYGIRKEAAFFSLFVFFQKFALGIAIGITGVVLGLAKYNKNACVQPKSVELALRYMTGLGGISFFLGAFISLYFYQLDMEKCDNIKKRFMRFRKELFPTGTTINHNDVV